MAKDSFDPQGAKIGGIMLIILTLIIISSFFSSIIGIWLNETISIGNIPNMPLSSLFKAGGAILLLSIPFLVLIYFGYMRGLQKT